MHKIKVNIADCKIGNVLARDIVNDDGIILVARNTAFNPFILSKLPEIGITSAYIYDIPQNANRQLKEHRRRAFESVYFDLTLSVKEILDSMAAGKHYTFDKISLLAERIFWNVYDADCVIGFLNELRYYNAYTYYHSANVAFYSMLIGKWMHLPKAEIMDSIIAGCLHDIGKLAVPLEILNKKGRLTAKEFEEVKEHSNLGYMMIRNYDGVKESIKEAVLSHHERLDGSGYPSGAREPFIGKYAKIVAIADVYDAITSERVYKHRSTPFEAFQMFATTGACQFDPYMVKVFLYNMAAHMVGLKVHLSDGRIGEVVYVPYHDITNPVVCIGSSYIDLSRNRELDIEAVI